MRIVYFTEDGYACIEETDKKRPMQWLISLKCLAHLAPSDDEVQQAIESILNKSPKEDK